MMIRPNAPMSDYGFCFGVEDLMDGYAVHTPDCPDAGRTWTGPNWSCPRRGGEPWDYIHRERLKEIPVYSQYLTWEQAVEAAVVYGKYWRIKQRVYKHKRKGWTWKKA